MKHILVLCLAVAIITTPAEAKEIFYSELESRPKSKKRVVKYWVLLNLSMPSGTKDFWPWRAQT